MSGASFLSIGRPNGSRRHIVDGPCLQVAAYATLPTSRKRSWAGKGPPSRVRRG